MLLICLVALFIPRAAAQFTLDFSFEARNQLGFGSDRLGAVSFGFSGNMASAGFARAELYGPMTENILDVAGGSLWSSTYDGGIATWNGDYEIRLFVLDESEQLQLSRTLTFTLDFGAVDESELLPFTDFTSPAEDLAVLSANPTLTWTGGITGGGYSVELINTGNTYNYIDGVASASWAPGDLSAYAGESFTFYVDSTLTLNSSSDLITGMTIGDVLEGGEATEFTISANSVYLESQGIASFQVASAVPEPSTYAAILGVVALGFVAWRRRRGFVA